MSGGVKAVKTTIDEKLSILDCEIDDSINILTNASPGPPSLMTTTKTITQKRSPLNKVFTETVNKYKTVKN